MKLIECDIGFTIEGVNYDFTHVASVTVEDPEETSLTRGANAGNKLGIIFKEGVKEPTKLTIPVMGLPTSVHELLKSVYDTEKRFDFYCISRKTGASKFAKNAVLCKRPQQLTLDETPDSMNVSLVIASFDVEDKPRG